MASIKRVFILCSFSYYMIYDLLNHLSKISIIKYRAEYVYIDKNIHNKFNKSCGYRKISALKTKCVTNKLKYMTFEFHAMIV